MPEDAFTRSRRLESRGETLKLARLLGIPAGELAFLEPLPPADLRGFRDAATRRLFDANSKLLDRVAAATRIIPAPVIASIAQHAFGPLLSARVAGVLETHKAVEVARRLPTDFVTDIAVQLDPRRAADIIGALPEDVIVPISAELGRRREYVSMGQFLAFVTDSCARQAAEILSDETLLRTSFMLEQKERLDRTLGLLELERIEGVLREADRLELWPEALALLINLPVARLGPIADLVAGFETEMVDRVLRVVAEARVWDRLLLLVGMMSRDSLVRLAARPLLADPEILRAVLVTAAEQDLWGDLLPLIDALPDETRALADRLITELPPTILDPKLARRLRQQLVALEDPVVKAKG